MKNTFCYNPQDGTRGTVVSNALFGSNGKQSLCNVIWDDGQHCTEKIENIDLTTEINPNPPIW